MGAGKANARDEPRTESWFLPPIERRFARRSVAPRTDAEFRHARGFGLLWLAKRIYAVAASAAALLSPFAFANPWVVEGRTVGISGGDTITVVDDSKTQHKIRIAAIDAPEKGQAFGKQSKQSLSELVFQKRVEARCHKQDRYGFEVCVVYVNRRDVGLEQIRQGMAWHYKEYQHEQPTQERLVYRDEEDAAKAARRGLWKDAKPVPPWEWRKPSG